MAPDHVCPDCLAIISDPRSESCASCGFVRPAGGWLVDPLTGLILGERYRLEGRLGAGGMASVFRASRIGALGGEVAVKILAPRFSRTVVARRFEREAKVVSRLTSPHIVRIYDYDTFRLPSSDQPLFYIAMELVHGTTLSAVLKKQGKVNFLWGIDVLRQTARGLEEAHREGITHRDIKPSNLMLVQQREATHVKIVDFGIAALAEIGEGDEGKLTQAGFVSGTPDYMAPEQAVGAPNVGPPADIYALGVVSFEMFSGRRPFEGDSIMDTLMQRVTRPAPALREVVPYPAFPGDLGRIVDRMLATRAEDRYQNAGELLDELAGFPAMQTTPDWVPPAQLVQQFATVQSHPALMAQPDAEDAGPDDAQHAETQLGPPAPASTRAPSATVSVVAEAPSAPPEKRRARWPWIAGGVVAAGGIGAGAWLLATGGAAPERVTPRAPTPVTSTRGEAELIDTISAAVGEDAATLGEIAPGAAADREIKTSPPPSADTSSAPQRAPVTLGHPRPPLEPGFVDHASEYRDLRVSVGIPKTLPPLYQPLPWRLAIDRAGEPLRLTGASVRLAMLPKGDPVGHAEGRGRPQDGRVALSLPPLPMATRYRAMITATLPDGTRVEVTLVYDADKGELSAP